jgi:hypothetical protein
MFGDERVWRRERRAAGEEGVAWSAMVASEKTAVLVAVEV